MGLEVEELTTQFQTRKVTLLALTHAVHDTYTGFLPALLPVLIEKFTLTNAAAGLLTLFLRLPSLLQPLIGRIADRKNMKLLIILSPAITGAGMSLLGVAPSYGFIIFLLILVGVSSASLHAVTPVLSSTFSGDKLGRGMSFWMVGGEMGRALGPVVIVSTISFLELEGLPWLAFGGGLMSLFLAQRLSAVTTITAKASENIALKTALKEMRWVLLPITVLIFTRSMVTATLTTFLPTFLREEGASLWFAGVSLTVLEIAGMIGAFMAGSLSDRLGRRRMLFISYIVTPIIMFLFVQSNALLRIPILQLLGFFSLSVTPVILAVVLENASVNRSFANGIFMAVSFLIQALATLMVGFISDLVDLRFTFLLSAALLPVGILVIRLLPDGSSKAALNN